MLRPTALLVLILLLAACETEPEVSGALDEPLEVESPGTPDLPPPEPALADGLLAETAEALDDDVSALPLPRAAATIQAWEERLEGEAFAPLRAELAALRGALAQSPLDGRAIADHLGALGEMTTAAAPTAPAAERVLLERLGARLTEAAGGLRQAATVPDAE